MCDSVLGLKGALGQDSKSSGQWWMWCLGPTWPELQPSVQETHCCTLFPIPSLLSQTVWEVFLWCSTWRWSNRDRQDIRGKKGRFPVGCVSPGCIQFLRGFVYLCFILFPVITLIFLAHTSIPWPFYSVCQVPMPPSFPSILDSRDNHFYPSSVNIGHSLIPLSFCVKEPIKHSHIIISIYFSIEYFKVKCLGQSVRMTSEWLSIL